MRLMEVGTKALLRRRRESESTVRAIPTGFNMIFWEINLKLGDKPITEIKQIEPNYIQPEYDKRKSPYYL